MSSYPAGHDPIAPRHRRTRRHPPQATAPAAAVSDGDRALDGQGFGPQEAWKYVTALAAAFT